MNLKPFLIDRLAAYLLGANIWGHIQAAVQIVENPNLSGAEKRSNALLVLKQVGVNIAGFLLNLGLELAVTKLRSLSPDAQK